MIKWFFAAGVCVVAVVLLASTPPLRIAPDLAAQVIECDVGMVSPGAKVERTVGIVNPLATPLTVRKIHADCPCVKKSISKQRIEPGGQAEAALTFLTSEEFGEFSHTVLFIFDETRTPVTVVVKGSVVGWLSRVEGDMRFGDVPMGAFAESSVAVDVNEPWLRDDIEVENDAEDLQIKILGRSKDRKNLVLHATFRPSDEAFVGRRWGHVTLLWKGHPERRVPLRWSAHVISSAELSPLVANFGVLELGKAARLTVQWKRSRASKLLIANDLVASSDFGEALQLSCTNGDSGDIRIEMRLSPDLLKTRGVVEGFANVAVVDRGNGGAGIRIPVLAYVPAE